MPLELPARLVEVDEQLHRLYERVHFSQFLNPTNAPQARMRFRRDGDPPGFSYRSASWADRELMVLDGLRPPTDHPLGAMFQDAIEGTRLFVLALRNRGAEDFDRLARFSAWYPDEETLSAARAERRERDGARFVLGAAELIEALEGALEERGMHDWHIEQDSVMSARVLVDGAKRLLRVSPQARFRQRDVRRLIVHEILVHALRSANGRQQPLRIFSAGLPGSLETEEGLALLAEEVAGVSSPGTLWRQGLVVRAVDWGRRMGFRELYRTLVEHCGNDGLSWGIAERLKRGLANPEEPGVYAKDVVYYRGLRRVKGWLDAGNPVAWLYVGKVGIHHPVSDWIEQGLVHVGDVPELFATDQARIPPPGPLDA